MNWEWELKNQLKCASRVVILGIGSSLRSDDIVGISVTQKIQTFIRNKHAVDKVLGILGETTPENFTGEIIRFQPSHIIFIDAINGNDKPGTIKIHSPENTNLTAFSTHAVPIKFMVEYLQNELTAKYILIGIQAKNLSFGEKISTEVQKSANRVSVKLSSILQNIFE